MTSDVETLDLLCDRSLAGDSSAESALFESLRVRFLPIAKRRVQMDHVEDVVQETLKIVFDRYGDRKPGQKILIWGLTVLRNVIGNYYQAKQRENKRLDFVEEFPAERAVTADAPMESEYVQTRETLSAAIAELSSRFPRCGQIFRSLLSSMEQGGSPNQVSSNALKMVQKDFPDLTSSNYYTSLHRCRGHLRSILTRLEEGTGNV